MIIENSFYCIAYLGVIMQFQFSKNKLFYVRAYCTLILSLSTLTSKLYGQNYEETFISNPRVGAYFSVVTHIVDYDFKKGNTDILPLHSVGFPVGVNFWVAKNFAFSIEFVPSVRLKGHLV